MVDPSVRSLLATLDALEAAAELAEAADDAADDAVDDAADVVLGEAELAAIPEDDLLDPQPASAQISTNEQAIAANTEILLPIDTPSLYYERTRCYRKRFSFSLAAS